MFWFDMVQPNIMKSATDSANPTFFTFENNQPRYKICCNLLHIWRTAQLVCILELFGTLALIVTLIVSFFVDIFDFPISTKEILISWCVVAFATSVCYLIGMIKLNSSLMIPRLIVQIINLVIDILLIGYASHLIANTGKFNGDNVDPDDDTVANHVFLIVWIVVLTLQLFFVITLYMAFRYVKDWTVYITYRWENLYCPYCRWWLYLCR